MWTIVKFFLVYIPFLAYSLWRISGISKEVFEEHLSSWPINRWLYAKLKGKLPNKWMEILSALLLFLNILWAAFADYAVGSYFNAGCGLIVALTIPLPSTFGPRFPGYKVNGDDPRGDMVANFHWFWVTVYTTWNALFAMVYTLDIWATAMHLVPVYLYCLIHQQWELFLGLRAMNLWLTMLCLPWSWPALLFGELLIIKDEMIAIVWGAVNLTLAVLYLIYYVWTLWSAGRNSEEELTVFRKSKPSDGKVKSQVADSDTGRTVNSTSEVAAVDV